VGFERPQDASKFLGALRKRLAEFGLRLNEEKTRVLEFGRYAAERRARRGARRPETFDFLGFTHICGVKRTNGGFTVRRLTVAKRWKATIDTNIGGTINFTRAVLPGMVKRDYGHIVNIGSIAGSWPYPTGNVYGATKAFLRQFTLNLRADLLGSNVRATCVEPGTSRTEFAAVRLGSANAAEKFYRQPNLLEADDIAEIVYFCTALPRRVNINTLEVMPISQAFAFPAFAMGMASLPKSGGRKARARAPRRR